MPAVGAALACWHRVILSPPVNGIDVDPAFGRRVPAHRRLAVLLIVVVAAYSLIRSLPGLV